jgi:hypothetical protein
MKATSSDETTLDERLLHSFMPRETREKTNEKMKAPSSDETTLNERLLHSCLERLNEKTNEINESYQLRRNDTA